MEKDFIYYFLHIGKTGGSTLEKHVRKSYKKEQYLELNYRVLKLDESVNDYISIYNAVEKYLSRLSKKRSVEFQIITDIDSLDTIGLERVKQIASKYIKKGNTDPLLFRIAYHWMSHNLKWLDSYKMEFEYSREKFKDYGESVKKETVKIFMDLIENKEYYFDTTNPNYKLIENFKPKKVSRRKEKH